MSNTTVSKAQAIQDFWEGFSIPAYDENSVPENATYPYLTYEYREANLGESVDVSASLWYRSTSWNDVSAKLAEIDTEITRGGKIIHADGGAIWIVKGVPFAQRMSDDGDDMVKRIYINISMEYIM